MVGSKNLSTNFPNFHELYMGIYVMIIRVNSWNPWTSCWLFCIFR